MNPVKFCHNSFAFALHCCVHVSKGAGAGDSCESCFRK